ncbi:tripartite tricarboxylate transporter TctB family protein [Oceanibaculum pacificum]|uniref:DUF1468 domain-containing protein n=1 Tax=Oceanibaculum pacificum TaxID=580166 RepID=A0A154VIB6_9PROT|nr:tripartite tricarboxylate transporter TctB family protein [Oceanibaculum pacificum]KZD01054.1 hypothetical protein AUP43_03700 [Oceanibaculum pacificum]
MTGGRAIGLACTVASILFLAILVPGIDANRFTGGGMQFYSVGPTALPYFAGGLMLLFSVLTLITSGQERPKPAESGVASASLWRPVVFILLAAALSGGMLIAGFLIAAILFLLAVFWIYGAASKPLALGLGVAVPLGVDLVLRKLFYIPLPVAPFLS